MCPGALGYFVNFQRLGLGPGPGVLGVGGKGWGARGVGQVWARGGLGARSGPGVVASCQTELGCVALLGALTKTEVG